MKKLIIIFALFNIYHLATAQITVDGIEINKLPVNYIEIVGTEAGLFTKKIIVAIDYGQEKKVFSSPSFIKDDKGKTYIFYSMVDALNFFENNGWQYVNNYLVTIQTTNVYHFLLKKK